MPGAGATLRRSDQSHVHGAHEIAHKSGFGFEPLIQTEPSGRRVALEWYIRSVLSCPSPAVLIREPRGLLGSYINGLYSGLSAYEWPIAQDCRKVVS